jgi:hypothetical protein
LTLFVFAGSTALAVLIYAAPEAAFKSMDNVPVKLLLCVAILVGLIAIGVLLYYSWYLPEPRRLLATTWRFMASICTISIGASVLAIPSLAKVDVGARISGDAGISSGAAANFEYVAAKGAAVCTTIVGLILVVTVTWLYVELVKWEHQHGRLYID